MIPNLLLFDRPKRSNTFWANLTRFADDWRRTSKALGGHWDGKFSVEVDLTEGDNKFLVEVLDSEGNKASRTVVVEHSTPGFGAALAVALLAVVSALMTKRRSWR